MVGQWWGKHLAVFNRGSSWHLCILVSCKCVHVSSLIAFGTTTNSCVHASASECICLFAFLSESCVIFTGCYVHEILCVWTSACSCLGHVWFLSAQGPPPCSKALLQGPKITSLSMLPGLWNNNTPGFPITTASANGDGTENMCGQTRAWGSKGGGAAREWADGKGEGCRD